MSEEVQKMVSSLENNVISGLLLIIGVLFFFLRDGDPPAVRGLQDVELDDVGPGEDLVQGLVRGEVDAKGGRGENGLQLVAQTVVGAAQGHRGGQVATDLVGKGRP